MAITPTTKSYPRGRQEKIRVAWEAAYGTNPGAGFSELNVYTSEFTRTRPLEDDDILGAGFANDIDSRPAAPAVEDATVKLSVPLDIAQIGFWLAAMFGRVVHSGSAPNVHTFASGAGPLTSLYIERELKAAAQYEAAAGFIPKSIKFPFGAANGYQQIDIEGVAQRIIEPYASTAAGMPTVEALANRVPKTTAILKVDTVQAAKMISGDITITNDVTLDRYVGDAAYPSAAAIEGTSGAASVVARYDDDTFRNYGAVGAGILPGVHQLDVIYQLTSSLLLQLTAINGRFQPVNLGTTNGKTRQINLDGRLELDATHPMLTAVLKNAHADY